MSLTITNEDNMALMDRYPDKYFDLAIVDPPYGIMKNTNPILRKAKMGKFSWDIVPNTNYWEQLFRVSKNVFIFGAQYFPLNFPKTVIFWDKNNFNPLYGDGELCFYYGKLKDMKTAKRNLGGVIKITCSIKQNKIHPTQKPVELYKEILHKFANTNDKILDTHLGSGSIAIACHDYGFDLIACELDKEYFDAAMLRINNHKLQQKLF